TDVYGLGATLYDVIAGQPPFPKGTLPEVIRRVLHDEPPPIHRHRPGLARDLSAVVMKCLEKDPRARYESAKALGEDLQRFLDGDPVAARRPSRAVVLWKRARRHKGAVSLAAALAVVALGVAGLWLRGQRVAARRTELAGELGERVTEMEMFLRTAHGLPLHDVEREREVVRGRLRGVATRMAEAGPIGAGPGHDALGRGALALGEPRAALEHFGAAERAGYRSPGLDYATGVALSALYKEALDATKREQSEAKRKARIAEIEAHYKAPAVARLRASVGKVVAPAAYVEGLVALHEGREEDAVERAGRAFAEAPWMHEAKKLEGDALFALGSRHRADKAFDYDKAMAAFERAARAYAEAAELGRSDPAVHAADCELWAQIMNAASEHGGPVRPGFERARAACERAIAASPQSPGAYVALARVHNGFAWWV
ncbi:MAG TPA: serine/threonine protein kinase, partial [Polyangiaceae bacterium]|nr:serine/threonine protein kinase [Polyangiaceae bacterium]